MNDGSPRAHVRFTRSGTSTYGVLDGSSIEILDGDLFANPRRTGVRIDAASAALLTPTAGSKMIGLWNNFHALAAKLESAAPAEPLYFIKSSGSFAAAGAPIRQPAAYDGRIVFEGELGIVIGTTARALDAREAEAAIFGYTCVNDVTAFDIIDRDPTFAQWARAKSFDGFGIFGPAVVSGLAPESLVVRTTVDGTERQNYPVSDMIFSPVELVRRISHDMTLFAGDVIACGTSIGAGRLKPGQTVAVTIDGIGTLENRFDG